MYAHAARVLPLLAGATMLMAADPVLGTWKLDVDKSEFRPGPTPASQTRVYEAGTDGVKVTIATTHADGRTTTVEHPANFDGKDYPLTGSGGGYAISMKKVDDYRSESVIKHASKTLGVAKRTVAEDGKSMTVTYKGVDGEGNQVDNLAVYVRQ